jgi:hypothetical protein
MSENLTILRDTPMPVFAGPTAILPPQEKPTAAFLALELKRRENG